MKGSILITLFFITASSIKLSAFHIVGGEIKLRHLIGSSYEFSLILYIDNTQNQNVIFDPSVQLSIFSNIDNALINTWVLDRANIKELHSSSPQCAIPTLSNSKVEYSAIVTLNQVTFNDPNGYYAVWERCCRNAEVANISNPTGTGIKFVLDFPAVEIGEEPFINSSPILSEPLLDYACAGQTFQIFLNAFDPDGDSLVYSLAVPLNSSSNDALPIPSPKPHINVQLREGFTLKSLIPIEGSITIDPKGHLKLKPTLPGLFQYAVKVDEYRWGKLIGRVMREYQLLVLDDCIEPSNTVSINASVRLPESSEIFDQEATFDLSEIESKCFEVLVTNLTNELNPTIRLVPINYELDNELTITENRISGETSVFTVCAPSCFLSSYSPLILDITANDGTCFQSSQKSLRVTLTNGSGNLETQVEVESCGPYSLRDSTMTTSGFYAFDFQDRFGCDSLVLLDLKVQDPPRAIITAIGYLLETEEQDSTFYQWINCDTKEEIPNATESSYKSNRPGRFSVIITKGLCRVESACIAIEKEPLSIVESEELVVYPNPTIDGTVWINNPDAELKLNYSVYDVAGKLISQGMLNEQPIIINGDSGIYFISIPTLNKQFRIVRK